MLRANLRSSVGLVKNRPERFSSTVKKAPLTGAQPPAGIDGLKFNQVNVQEIQQRFESVEDSLRQIKAASVSTSQPDADENTKMFRIGFWISAVIFCAGFFYACFDQLVVNKTGAFVTREQNARAYEKQAEIYHLYENNITKKDFVDAQLEERKREYQEKRDEEDKSVMPSEWRRANLKINPADNFTEEIKRVEQKAEDPRSLEEIKASVERLSNGKL